MEAVRDTAEYDECEHGVPGGNDCADCMKRAHADEVRALNEEAEALATERDEARREAAEAMAIIQRLTIDPRPLTPAEFAHGATITPASELVGSRCGKVVSERRIHGTTCRIVCPLLDGHEGPCAEALGDGGSSG